MNAKVMGALDRLVEEGSTDKIEGPFGLCRRNKRANMLIDFACNMI
jgi:hypothetical protein